MKTMIRNTFVLASAILCFAGSRLSAQISVDIVASPTVPASSLDKAALKDILLGKTAYWNGGQSVTIVVLTGKTDAALEDITGMSAGSFKTYWQRLTFSGRGKEPKEADSLEKLASLLSDNKGAVAMVPAGTAVAGVKKIELK